MTELLTSFSWDGNSFDFEKKNERHFILSIHLKNEVIVFKRAKG